MTEYAKLIIGEDYISVSFDAGNEDIQAIENIDNITETEEGTLPEYTKE